jgi:hypothetical protein
MQTYVRGYVADDARAAVAEAQPGTPIRFVASTEGVARDRLTIAADGWQLANYRANPVVLWVHNYGGSGDPATARPIGRAESVRVEGGQLVADVRFNQANDFARAVEADYRAGFLSAVSVGWDTLEFEPDAKGDALGSGKVVKAELLDISAVPVPGDPKALMERQKRMLVDLGRDLLKLVEPETAGNQAPGRDPMGPSGFGRELVGASYPAEDWPESLRTSPLPGRRSAIPYKKTPLADRNATWDGPAQIAKCDAADDLRAICAWFETGADPDLKQSYKFPHHNVPAGEPEGGYPCVFAGCVAVLVRLGQADIPDADRRGVHAHIARHYEDFGETAPEYRTYAETAALGPAEFRGLFLAGEPERYPHLFPPAGTRVGSVLSARNRDDLEQAHGLIGAVLARAQKAEPDQTDAERTTTDALGAIAQALGVAA